jgi:hypothetical protein
MKKIFFLSVIALGTAACAQKSTGLLNAAEAERIERTLAADDMGGRKPGTPGITKAANFIAAEFKKAGLQPFSGTGFMQDFVMLRPKLVSLKTSIEGAETDNKNVVVITGEPRLMVTETSGYDIAGIGAGENLGARARALISGSKNTVAFVDASLAGNFARLTSLKRQLFKPKASVIFILGSRASRFTIEAEHSFEETPFANVVGILPGKTKAGEYVIFSGHYDHLGITKTPQGTDSIYNGANDDAAGTTGVIMLANYFKKLNNNERTLVFAAFTAEESGGFGSQYFSQQFTDPEAVKAMFNLEMIGTESKWGAGSAYITGYEKTNMGEILQKNLKGTSFTFYPDPYPEQNLFYRSDNATLARLGVPAHTISTSKMDSEPNYHKLSDEVSTLDMKNMAEIIKAIAFSSATIVSGKDTPTRVDTKDLR